MGTITHTKVSGKANPADPTIIGGGHWDAVHTFALAAGDISGLGSFATISSLAHASTTGITATDHHAAPVAGPDANVAVDVAGAAGTASTFARSAHGHQLVTSAVAAAAIGTAGAGSSGTAPSRGDHIHPTGAGTPSTQAIGDAAATGSGPAASMTDHKHAMPAFGTGPAAVGTQANGVSANIARIDHVHATGAGTPSTQAFGDAAATGSGPAASMTDHKHAMPANPVSFATPAIVLGTAAAAGAAGTVIRSDSTILAFDATVPAALGAAAAGVATVAGRRDHVHPTTGLALDPHGAAQHTDITRKILLLAADAKLDVATAVNLGASANLLGAVAYADAATQGAFWTFEVPADWASGVITIQPVWSPGSTDGVAHTVRWSMTCKTLAAGVTVTAAGTTVAFTGSSATRTVAVLVYDTATSTTLTPAAAGDLFMVEIQRIGADANDTYVGVVNLIGAIVSYTASQ